MHLRAAMLEMFDKQFMSMTQELETTLDRCGLVLFDGLPLPREECLEVTG